MFPLQNRFRAVLLFVLATASSWLVTLAVMLLLQSGVGGLEPMDAFSLSGWRLWAVMVVNSVGLFLLPAVVAAPGIVGGRLLRGGYKPVPEYLFAAVVLGFVCQPLVAWASWWGTALCQNLGWQSSASATEAMVVALLPDKSAATLTLALLLVAVLPAVCEEAFFRGAMLPLLRRLTRSWAAAVWIVAIIFSLAHADAQGFLARLLLGLLLGTLYVLTRSLWAPIMLHLTNNASTVVALVCSEQGIAETLAAPPENPPLWMTLLSLALVMGELHWIHKGVKN